MPAGAPVAQEAAGKGVLPVDRQRLLTMIRCIKMAVVYFAIVFATGFAFGVLRVMFFEPHLGIRRAQLLEMPLMFAVMVLTAVRLFRRGKDQYSPAELFAIGGLALGLLVAAELIGVLALRGISISQYIAEQDSVSGTVYGFMLLLFAVMPWLVAGRKRDNQAMSAINVG